jgi:RHS repeat-associated protein
MVWEAAQEPFGKVVPVATGIPLSERVRFPGQYYDAESGLHQNWWRDYSPKTGRYLEPDPIGLDGGMNLYKYALNSPVNSTDRRGLYDEEGHGKSTEAAREIGVLNFIANAITQANVDTDRLFNPCDCSATTNKYHFNTRDGAWKMIRDAPNIVVLGRALHALQDTYAHAGMTCGVNSGRRHLMGNPDKFVGNSRDLQMMKATEEALRAYFENHPMRKDQ